MEKKVLSSFTDSEIAKLRQLFKQKDNAISAKQKGIRAKIRKMGFYITDYASEMNSTDFENLLKSKKIVDYSKNEYKLDEETSCSEDKKGSYLGETESNDSVFNKNYKEGLEPWIDMESEILILGSLPSDVSIKKQAYYQNKSYNDFWNLMHDIYGKGDDSKKFLLDNHIALWDCLAAANREGNLDKKISGGKRPNKIPELLEKYSKIHKIIINGKTTTKKIFNRYFNELRNKKVDIIFLPSSSHCCTMYYEEKLNEWKNKLM